MGKKKRSKSLIPAERIEGAILLIRGEKVMLDRDLAELYQVETRVLVQAVKRNLRRFPEDFMFQLTKEELEAWRSHFVMSNPATLEKKYDERFKVVFEAIRQLMAPHDTKKKSRIGFRSAKE